MTVPEYRSVPVGELSTFVGNPRRGDVAAIARSLDAYGQYRPIVVNAGTFARMYRGEKFGAVGSPEGVASPLEAGCADYTTTATATLP